jgi:flagellar biogenesis protein FliO
MTKNRPQPKIYTLVTILLILVAGGYLFWQFSRNPTYALCLEMYPPSCFFPAKVEAAPPMEPSLLSLLIIAVILSILAWLVYRFQVKKNNDPAGNNSPRKSIEEEEEK